MRRPSARLEVTQDMIGELEFFSALADGRRKQVAAQCEGRLYAPSSEIISHYDESRDVHFLLSGKAQVTVYSASGRVVTFDEIGPGTMFGEFSAIDRQPRVAGVTAIEECRVVRLADDLFVELVTTEPPLAHYTLRRLTNLLRQHCERIFEFHTLPVPARIRAEFLRLAEAQMRGDDRVVLSPKPADQDVANRVGTNREQVNRARRAMLKRGVLEEDGANLVVPSVARLRLEVGK